MGFIKPGPDIMSFKVCQVSVVPPLTVIKEFIVNLPLGDAQQARFHNVLMEEHSDPTMSRCRKALRQQQG